METQCQCGCGQPAPISPYSDRKRGYVKGQPRRFVYGHQLKSGKQPSALQKLQGLLRRWLNAATARLQQPRIPRTAQGTIIPHTDELTRRATELYLAGNSLTDVAEALGYARGDGQNRVKRMLMRAGVDVPLYNRQPQHGRKKPRQIQATTAPETKGSEYKEATC